MIISSGSINLNNDNVFLTSSQGNNFYEDVLSNNIQINNILIDHVPVVNYYIIDNILSSSNNSYFRILPLNLFRINEEFLLNDNIIISPVLYIAAINNINITSAQLLNYLEILSESISYSESLSGIRYSIHILENIINNNDLLNESQQFNELLSNILNIIVSDEFISYELIQENIPIVNNIYNLILKYTIVLSNIQLAAILTNLNAVMVLSKENITLLDSPSPSSLYNILSSSEIQLIIGQQDSDKYISYLLEPETFSTSTYSNYNFSQSTKFNNKYIFSNKDGLYEYGSEYDDGEIITARIQTAALDFGTSNLKQMPYFYIGVTNSNKLVLKLSVDGKASVYYKLNKKTDYLSNQKISIGKGLIGRYFQFELITEENTDFNMESIEFTPLVLRRKL